MAGLEGFAYYKEITISNTNVDADIANFPVYVSVVNDTNIGGHCVGTNGYDVQFANADNSETLTFERIYWNNPAGTANGDFYVLVNPVDHDANTVIRCYYGKNGESDHSSPENTFATTNGWAAVWHLEEAGVSYLDATPNNNDSDASTDPAQITGKVGHGQDFTAASSQYIRFPDSDSLEVASSDFTITCWFYLKSNIPGGDERSIFHKGGNSTDYYKLNLQSWTSQNRLWLDIKDDADLVLSTHTTNLNTGTWYYGAVQVDRDVSDGARITVDATSELSGDPTVLGNITNSSQAYLARNYGYGTYSDIYIDEYRFSKVLRSNAWIKFEYYNSHDGHAAGNELSWGSETPTAGPAEPIYLIWTK